MIELHRRWHNVSPNYMLLIENKASGMSLIQDLRQQQINPIPIQPAAEKIIRMKSANCSARGGLCVPAGPCTMAERFSCGTDGLSRRAPYRSGRRFVSASASSIPLSTPVANVEQLLTSEVRHWSHKDPSAVRYKNWKM